MEYSLPSVIKSAALAPLVVPACMLIYLLSAPVTMGAVHAGEATFVVLVMVLALSVAYALFVLAVLPVYIVVSRKKCVGYGIISLGSAILGLLSGLLAAYLLSISGATLAIVDVAAVCCGVAAAALSIANAFIYLAQRFQRHECADV